MKKAAKILFLISGIVSLALAVLFLILGIVSLATGVAAIVASTAEGLTEEQIAALVASGSAAIGTGVWLLIEIAFAVVSAVVSFKARNTDKKPLFIVAIVFGALGMTVVPIVAGIFGLIAGDTLE